MTYDDCKKLEVAVLERLARQHGFDLTLTADDCVIDGVLARDGNTYPIEIKTRPHIEVTEDGRWMDEQGRVYDCALFDEHKILDVKRKAEAMGGDPIVAQYLPRAGRLYSWNLGTVRYERSAMVESQASMAGGTKNIKRIFLTFDDAKIQEIRL